MTATVPDLDDLALAIQRADGRYATRNDDDRIPDARIEYYANAARQHFAVTAAPAAGDPGAERALRADTERLTESVAELRGHVERADRNAAKLRTQLDQAPKPEELTAARTEADTWRGEYDRVVDEALAQSTDAAATRAALEEQNRVLGEQLAELRTAAERTLEEITAADAEHKHYYPWPSLAAQPLSCECGQPYPGAFEYEDEPDDEPAAETWDDLLGRVRTELAAWPPSAVDEREEL